ncbi:ParH-like protein [Kitasatospora sp. NPDC101235]|uniref:ParH-like protein n=1 Tax=Kitasatospora sp. NPDC101235 TaxID=3364101 RepID=UPI0038103E41
MELPDPFDAEALVHRVAEQRGRRIELLPTPWRPGVPCGLVVTTDEADYIVYSSDTSPLHRQHILLHEVAHLLCGHLGPLGESPFDGASAGEESPGVRALVPSLSPALVHRVLGRTVYSEPQEQEAELLASMVLNRAVRCPSGVADAVGETHSRLLEPFFGPSTGKRRGV